MLLDGGQICSATTLLVCKRNHSNHGNGAEFKAYAALEQGAPIAEWSYTPIALGDDQVEIRITASGLCHSDHHQVGSRWDAVTVAAGASAAASDDAWPLGVPLCW